MTHVQAGSYTAPHTANVRLVQFTSTWHSGGANDGASLQALSFPLGFVTVQEGLHSVPLECSQSPSAFIPDGNFWGSAASVVPLSARSFSGQPSAPRYPAARQDKLPTHKPPAWSMHAAPDR